MLSHRFNAASALSSDAIATWYVCVCDPFHARFTDVSQPCPLMTGDRDASDLVALIEFLDDHFADVGPEDEEVAHAAFTLTRGFEVAETAARKAAMPGTSKK